LDSTIYSQKSSPENPLKKINKVPIDFLSILIQEESFIQITFLKAFNNFRGHLGHIALEPDKLIDSRHLLW